MFTPLLAKLQAHPAFPDALGFILTGLFLVIGALLILSGLIAAFGAYFSAKDKQVARNRPLPGSPSPYPIMDSPVPTPSAADDSPVLAALIATAVHVALEGQEHRVVHIEPQGVGWAREGRREIFSSHRVR